MDVLQNPEFWYGLAVPVAIVIYAVFPGPQGKIVGKLLTLIGDRMKEQAKSKGKKEESR